MRDLSVYRDRLFCYNKNHKRGSARFSWLVGYMIVNFKPSTAQFQISIYRWGDEMELFTDGNENDYSHLIF